MKLTVLSGHRRVMCCRWIRLRKSRRHADGGTGFVGAMRGERLVRLIPGCAVAILRAGGRMFIARFLKTNGSNFHSDMRCGETMFTYVVHLHSK